MKLPTILFAIGLVFTAECRAEAQSPSQDLQQLFMEEHNALLRTEPLMASSEGVHAYDDRLPIVTPSSQAQRVQADKQWLDRLHQIDRATLSPSDQISYQLFDFMISQRIALAAHQDWRIPFNSDSGFHADLLYMHELVEFKTTKNYQNYIARLNAIPRYFDENIANMQLGMRDGFTLPAEILPGISKVVAGEQFKRAEDSPLFQPFLHFPESVTPSERAKLVAAGRQALQTKVLPTYARFQIFFENTYRPNARKTIGASALPNGQSYYTDLVRYYTTLPDATPEHIHQVGLAEVKRIRAEMETIIAELGYQGSFSDFLSYLRTDPQFYAKSPEQLLNEAKLLAKQVDAKLPEYFGKLPSTPYIVRAVPAEIAPNYTGGRYNPGATGRPGEYWVNTYALNTRPLYVLPALTLHEAVPGHHLQGALARELTDVPTFRQNFYPHAFGEGWGLYSEKLGLEMGLYQTPYQHFGRLTYEMWRACRLVVDTGMHSQGWTRQQAIDFLSVNTALSSHEIQTEVDRYIGWPGQALAYKTGEMKIIELRRYAEQELGAKFEIRAFHDAVLDSGGVTLPVLERQIQTYIEQNKTN